ncbi:MAG: thiamine pyrophosphate-binding protein [Desulfobacterales bacterium]|nr:thiamine pyrophosphate-binding protein [Desulfobacterales bacterium]
MEMVKGGKLAAEAIIERGIEYVFTLSGGHITPIYQFLENSSVKIFDTRHEQAAVFMAEAWGKMTKKPGVAMVTAGPGFTNALTAIASAYFSNTPLILISGCVGIECAEKLDLQDMRQIPVIEPIVKKALVCQKTERIPEFFDHAYRTAVSGRPGPVYLEFPVDILNASVPINSVKKLKTSFESSPVDIEGAKKIIEMLEASEKPIIIAGSGAWASNAGQNLIEFIEKTGAPIFTSLTGRGVVPDTHPLCFESSLAIRPGGSLIAHMTTDLIIFLGTRMSLYYIFGDIFNPAAKLVHVDIKPEEIGRNKSVDLGIVSDIKALINECNKIIDEKRISEKLKNKFSSWITQIKASSDLSKAGAKKDWESINVPIHPMRLAKEIDDFMNREDDIVVADGGDTTTWMGMTRTIRKPGHYLDYGLFGSLAVGMPYANAAKLKYPNKRVCLICGDGSIGFNFMEFETSIRKKLPIVVVINNDLGWGMIRHSQELKIGHAITDGTFIGKVEYHKLVEALGGKGLFVEKPEDIRPALEEAFASGKTACINVMTDPTTISPGSIALANLGGYKA